jgi:hypothetical protein
MFRCDARKCYREPHCGVCHIYVNGGKTRVRAGPHSTRCVGELCAVSRSVLVVPPVGAVVLNREDARRRLGLQMVLSRHVGGFRA